MRFSGLRSRSDEFTKSHPNLPLTHVEMPLAGPCSGSIFRMCRSRVQMSKLQPTPQYTHTVLVRFTRCFRISASMVEIARIAGYPVDGSTPFTTSIMSSSTLGGSAVR